MMLRIRIRTPDGYARSTEKKIKPFIIGNKGKMHKILTTKKDNQIIWIVDAKPRQYTKIIKNVAVYKTMITKIMSNKTVRKMAKLTDEQKADLDHMLVDQTEIDVVKLKDWEKIKKEFK